MIQGLKSLMMEAKIFYEICIVVFIFERLEIHSILTQLYSLHWI
jgi:hypothetical protein